MTRPISSQAAARLARMAAKHAGNPPVDNSVNPYDLVARVAFNARTGGRKTDPTIESTHVLEVVKSGDEHISKKREAHYLAQTITLPDSFSEEEAELIRLFIVENATNLTLDEDKPAALIEGTSDLYRDSQTQEWKVDVLIRANVTREMALESYQAFLKDENGGHFVGKAFMDASTAVKWHAKNTMQTLLETVLTSSGCNDWAIEEANVQTVRKRVFPLLALETSLTGGSTDGLYTLGLARR